MISSFPYRTYKVCLLVKSSLATTDPENCAPKFSLEKAVAYKPLPPAEPSESRDLNQSEEEEGEEYNSYSDADYSHLYMKLSHIYDDDIREHVEEGESGFSKFVIFKNFP